MARLTAKSSKTPPMARLNAKSYKTPNGAPHREELQDPANGADTVEMPRDLRDLSPNIPVIDFSLLSSGGEGERRRINPPAKEWGFFQVWSNGMYQSNERRALTNEEKARMSPATFIPPDENVKIRQ
uniref:Uncharacterized protein n=1 Tax=Ananas comosus var. bracteatus TaxID=296719 RepID=A0A6V7PDI1_ANACO|nr:unnamed protein product [Ananas comosus var. bracteatus]